MNWVEGEVCWHLESPEFSPQHKTEQNLQVIKVLGIITLPTHTHLSLTPIKELKFVPLKGKVQAR